MDKNAVVLQLIVASKAIEAAKVLMTTQDICGDLYAHTADCPKCRGVLHQIPPNSGVYKHSEDVTCNGSIAVLG